MGLEVGPVGTAEGSSDGSFVGSTLGTREGDLVGLNEGAEIGCLVGTRDGLPVSIVSNEVLVSTISPKVGLIE